jgi:hypothetical protein
MTVDVRMGTISETEEKHSIMACDKREYNYIWADLLLFVD